MAKSGLVILKAAVLLCLQAAGAELKRSKLERSAAGGVGPPQQREGTVVCCTRCLQLTSEAAEGA